MRTARCGGMACDGGAARALVVTRCPNGSGLAAWNCIGERATAGGAPAVGVAENKSAMSRECCEAAGTDGGAATAGDVGTCVLAVPKKPVAGGFGAVGGSAPVDAARVGVVGCEMNEKPDAALATDEVDTARAMPGAATTGEPGMVAICGVLCAGDAGGAAAPPTPAAAVDAGCKMPAACKCSKLGRRAMRPANAAMAVAFSLGRRA